MGGLEGRDDALGAREPSERIKDLVVVRGRVLGASDRREVRVFGTDAGVVESSRDRVRLEDLAEVVLEELDRIPWRMPGRPAPIAAPPRASTPTRRAPVSTNPLNSPMAFEPPPTQATTTSGTGAPRGLRAGRAPRRR